MQEVPVPPKPDVPLKTIPATVSSMSTTQLYDVMWSMKNLINTNIEQARKILKNNPSFAYAILQAQVVLGLADANAIQQALIQSLPPQPQIMTPLHVNPALQANRFPIPNQTFPNNQYPIPNLQPGAYQQSNPRPAAPAAFPGFPGTAVPVDLQDILAQVIFKLFVIIVESFTYLSSLFFFNTCIAHALDSSTNGGTHSRSKRNIEPN